MLLIFFILSALPHNAQELIVTGLPSINRLPTKEILYIFQDSEGYMWYSTEGGLCRDDGYQVSVFRSDFNTPELLESNSVTCIAEDKEGKIWFGTRRGMYILDKRDYRIQPLSDSEIKGWVIRMAGATSDGSVWVSSEKYLFRYDTSGRRLGKYETKWEDSSKEVNSICEDNEGTIWMVQLKGGLFRYDVQEDRFVRYPWSYEMPATCIVKDVATPYYWIGTWGHGIVRFDAREKDIDRMFVSQPATDGYADADKKRIFGIAQDSVRHHLWVTAADNLYAYEVAENEKLRPVDISDFLPEDKQVLNGVMCDRQGNLWVTGNYPDSYSFIVSYLPDRMISYPMEPVKEELGVYASPMELYYEKGYYWIRQKRMAWEVKPFRLPPSRWK